MPNYNDDDEDEDEDPFDIFDDDEDLLTEEDEDEDDAAPIQESSSKVEETQTDAETLAPPSEQTAETPPQKEEGEGAAADLSMAAAAGMAAHALTAPAAKEQEAKEESHPSSTPALQTTMPTHQDSITKMEDIPLKICVEVAQLSLSIHDLLAVQAGNIMQLPATPESSVSLTLNGKQIGTGELIKIGDMLGIKILKIHAS